MAGHGADEERSPGVLHLGEVGAGGSRRSVPASGDPPATRRRWMIAVAVFLVGAIVGGYAWLLRSDMRESAQVDLAVTSVMHDAPLPGGRLTDLSVDVRNLGSEDVTITGTSLPGQAAAGDRGSREVSIRAGEHAVVALNGALSCRTGFPDVIEADVRTPAGETSTRLAVPPTRVSASVCGSADEAPIVLAPSAALSRTRSPAEITESGVAMTIPFRVYDSPASGVEIVDVAISAVPGVVAETGLERGETDNRADVSVEWTIEDCPTPDELGPVEVTFEFADHEPATVRAPEYVLRNLLTAVESACES